MTGDCPAAVRSYKDFLATRPGPAEERAAREAITPCGGTYEPPPPAPPVPAPVAFQPPLPPPPPRSQPRDPWYRDSVALTSLVLGGVAVAGGATSFWLASRARDDAEQLGRGGNTLAEFEAHVDDVHRYRWIGGAALGVGGALLVVATVKLVTGNARATPKTTASVTASDDVMMMIVGRAF